MKRIRQIFNLTKATIAILYYSSIFSIGTSKFLKLIWFDQYYWFLFQSKYDIKVITLLMVMKAGINENVEFLQTCHYFQEGACCGHDVCKKNVLKKYNEIYLTDYKFLSVSKY